MREIKRKFKFGYLIEEYKIRILVEKKRIMDEIMVNNINKTIKEILIEQLPNSIMNDTLEHIKYGDISVMLVIVPDDKKKVIKDEIMDIIKSKV